MSISINWSTKVITIPQADLTLISGSLYELDVNALRLILKDLEDSEDGIAYPTTHNHNTETVLSGVTYARIFEVINGYTITFEDGQYTVRCVGANHNIADVKNVNQVSLIVGNSAGLVVSDGGFSNADRAKLEEVFALHGLDAAKPLVVTPTTRQAGAGIEQTIVDNAGEVTVQRV